MPFWCQTKSIYFEKWFIGIPGVINSYICTYDHSQCISSIIQEEMTTWCTCKSRNIMQGHTMVKKCPIPLKMLCYSFIMPTFEFLVILTNHPSTVTPWRDSCNNISDFVGSLCMNQVKEYHSFLGRVYKNEYPCMLDASLV